MSNRKNLSQRADEIVAFLDQNPADTGKKGGHDVSNQPRVPKGSGDKSGEWTRAGSGAATQPTKKYPGGDPEVYLDKMESILGELAKRLDISPTWIMGLSSYESGWLDDHNMSLNNPFGVTRAGGKNLEFESLQEAADYWERHYGDRVRGAKSAQEFVDRLQNPRLGKPYNSVRPDWKPKVLDNVNSVQKRLARRQGKGQ